MSDNRNITRSTDSSQQTPRVFSWLEIIMDKTNKRFEQILLLRNNETVCCNITREIGFVYWNWHVINLKNTDKDMFILTVDMQAIIFAPKIAIQNYFNSCQSLKNIIKSLETIKTQTWQQTSSTVNKELEYSEMKELTNTKNILYRVTNSVACLLVWNMLSFFLRKDKEKIDFLDIVSMELDSILTYYSENNCETNPHFEYFEYYNDFIILLKKLIR